MKGIIALAAIALPVTAQVAPTTGTAPLTTGTRPTTAGTVPATGAGTLAGPFGSGTVNVAPSTTQPLIPTTPNIFTPPAVGQTFSAPTLAPNNLGTLPPVNLNGTVTPGAFPPPVNGSVPPLVTNTGIGGFAGGTVAPPDASTFPVGSPPFIGNTVGQDFAAPFTNFPPRRALSVNLPPGALVDTNGFGLPNPVTVPPGLVPTSPMNTIGAPAGSQVGRVGPVASPPLVQPPTAPPLAPLPPRNPGARIPRVAH